MICLFLFHGSRYCHVVKKKCTAADEPIHPGPPQSVLGKTTVNTYTAGYYPFILPFVWIEKEAVIETADRGG